MEWWHAALLGLVEGITEYLPISSTGHLILASSLLGLDRPEQKSALAAFEVAIQGGAILAVLGLYARRVAQMARGLVGRDPAGLRLLLHVALAFLPAALLGPLLDDPIEAVSVPARARARGAVRGRALDDLARSRAHAGAGRPRSSRSPRAERSRSACSSARRCGRERRAR